MSKLTRFLAVGATLAAISVAGMTTVAHAQPADESSSHDTRRPPTQGQVGEAWHQRPVTSQQQTQATAADAVGRLLARERSAIPNPTSAQVPTPAPNRPNQRPSWVLAAFGVLAATLVLVVGLAVLAGRRASHRTRLGAASPTQ